MTRRPPRAPTRRLALAVSVMLLAAAMTVPAFATDHVVEAEILSPLEGDVVYLDGSRQLLVQAKATPDISVRVAVRTTTATDTTCATSPDLDGIYRDISNGLRTDEGTGIWQEQIRVPDDAANGWYCFAFDPSDGPRISVKFELAETFVEFEQDEIEICEVGEECTNSTAPGEGGNAYTVSTDSAQPKDGETTPRIGLRAVDEDLAATVAKECTDLLDPRRERLSPQVVHLLPDGFAEDSDLTVTSTIPMEYVRDRSNQPQVRSRGNAAFQVCIAPTADEVQTYIDAGYDENDLEEIEEETDLFGPILLNDCETDEQTACVESRNRADNELTEEKTLNITYRIPAVDPWMM